jgi:hypothetical protein
VRVPRLNEPESWHVKRDPQYNVWLCTAEQRDVNRAERKRADELEKWEEKRTKELKREMEKTLGHERKVKEKELGFA